MRHFNFLKRNIKKGMALLDEKCFSDKRINFKRILILNKRTRYELERILRPGINDDDLERIIRNRGSDFDKLIFHHNVHTQLLDEIVKSFSKFGTEIQVVNRSTFGEKHVNWADLIVVGGGDGTFLLGANQIFDEDKPIVGFNSNPGRSEGHLCLPKKYTYDIPSAVNKIMKNQFSWLLRNRVEIKIEGVQALDDPVALDSTRITGIANCLAHKQFDSEVKERILPSLALNEVFMGEIISSNVSHLVIKPHDLPETTVKCSGLCVCTGTGSTSWHLSINRLTEDKVKKLLLFTGQSVDKLTDITEKFNSSIVFSPEEERLGWSMREPIYSSVFPDPPGFPAAGMTSEMTISSRLFSGFLVVDGIHCCPFHDGTQATLYPAKGKRLRCIVLD